MFSWGSLGRGREPAHFAAREEKGADAVGFGGLGVEGDRRGADRLDVGEFSVRGDTRGERSPGATHGGLEARAVEHAFVHAPGEGITIKTRAARLLHRETF